jgi:hypothetical protein
MGTESTNRRHACSMLTRFSNSTPPQKVADALFDDGRVHRRCTVSERFAPADGL